MKLVDRVIDYVANRVLDRMQERKPTFTVNNVHTTRNFSGDVIRVVNEADFQRAMRKRDRSE